MASYEVTARFQDDNEELEPSEIDVHIYGVAKGFSVKAHIVEMRLLEEA